jgi:hypothetical protein
MRVPAAGLIVLASVLLASVPPDRSEAMTDPCRGGRGPLCALQIDTVTIPATACGAPLRFETHLVNAGRVTLPGGTVVIAGASNKISHDFPKVEGRHELTDVQSSAALSLECRQVAGAAPCYRVSIATLGGGATYPDWDGKTPVIICPTANTVAVARPQVLRRVPRPNPSGTPR